MSMLRKIVIDMSQIDLSAFDQTMPAVIRFKGIPEGSAVYLKKGHGATLGVKGDDGELVSSAEGHMIDDRGQKAQCVDVNYKGTGDVFVRLSLLEGSSYNTLHLPESFSIVTDSEDELEISMEINGVSPDEQPLTIDNLDTQHMIRVNALTNVIDLKNIDVAYITMAVDAVPENFWQAQQPMLSYRLSTRPKEREFNVFPLEAKKTNVKYFLSELGAGYLQSLLPRSRAPKNKELSSQALSSARMQNIVDTIYAHPGAQYQLDSGLHALVNLGDMRNQLHIALDPLLHTSMLVRVNKQVRFKTGDSIAQIKVDFTSEKDKHGNLINADEFVDGVVINITDGARAQFFVGDPNRGGRELAVVNGMVDILPQEAHNLFIRSKDPNICFVVTPRIVNPGCLLGPGAAYTDLIPISELELGSYVAQMGAVVPFLELDFLWPIADEILSMRTGNATEGPEHEIAFIRVARENGVPVIEEVPLKEVNDNRANTFAIFEESIDLDKPVSIIVEARVTPFAIFEFDRPDSGTEPNLQDIDREPQLPDTEPLDNPVENPDPDPTPDPSLTPNPDPDPDPDPSPVPDPTQPCEPTQTTIDINTTIAIDASSDNIFVNMATLMDVQGNGRAEVVTDIQVHSNNEIDFYMYVDSTMTYELMTHNPSQGCIIDHEQGFYAFDSVTNIFVGGRFTGDPDNLVFEANVQLSFTAMRYPVDADGNILEGSLSYGQATVTYDVQFDAHIALGAVNLGDGETLEITIDFLSQFQGMGISNLNMVNSVTLDIDTDFDMNALPPTQAQLDNMDASLASTTATNDDYQISAEFSSDFHTVYTVAGDDLTGDAVIDGLQLTPPTSFDSDFNITAQFVGETGDGAAVTSNPVTVPASTVPPPPPPPYEAVARAYEVNDATGAAIDLDATSISSQQSASPFSDMMAELFDSDAASMNGDSIYVDSRDAVADAFADIGAEDVSDQGQLRDDGSIGDAMSDASLESADAPDDVVDDSIADAPDQTPQEDPTATSGT